MSKNKPKCPFCSGLLTGRVYVAGLYSWNECSSCKVSFTKGRDTNGRHIKFELRIDDWMVALNLYPDANTSVLTAYHPEGSLENSTRIELDYCPTDITPANVQEKARFILTWQ